MSEANSTELDDLVFEQKDSEIFCISDVKTKLDTLQNYFFPRLESLLRHSIEIIQDIYDENPYDRMSFVYRPSHRKRAQKNQDTEEVHIGLAGRRRSDRVLNIKRRDGTCFSFHPTYLTFTVIPTGGLQVVYLPFRQAVDAEFVAAIGQQFRDNLPLLSPILANSHIAHNTAWRFFDVMDNFDFIKLGENGYNPAYVKFLSPVYYFPIQSGRGLWDLVLAFISMYPLLSASVSIGEWEESKLHDLLNKFRDWYDDLNTVDPDEDDEEEQAGKREDPDLPELDNYHFVRAGVRWEIFARDRWTCRSCGRSPKEDGVTLEVDHILPRSKGGTNDKSNLQTLCKKCNVGKSNRDETDLRA